MKKSTLILLVALIVLDVGLWLCLFVNGKEIHHENGPMENSQLALLAVSTVVFFACVRATVARPLRLFCWALTWLLLNLTIRETKIRGEGVPYAVELFFNDPWRILWLGAGWLVLFIYFLKNKAPVWAEFSSWLKTSPARLMVVAGAFYVSSWPFDQQWVPIPHRWNVFMEEATDCVSSVLILFAAVQTLAWVRVRHSAAKPGAGASAALKTGESQP